MKKLYLFSMMCFAALTMNAQKCAVLEFRGAQSVSVADVDGITEMFMTYFRPAGYTMVERAQIDKVISEQGFQRSNLTNTDAVRVGRILNVSKVVVGKVSRLGGQYQVDVRVVDVESGHDVASDGATFSGDYRTNVRNLATKLASKIAVQAGSTVQSNQSVHGQDYVSLGLPSGTLWKKKNERELLSGNNAMNKYSNQLPTKWQWQELQNSCRWVWTGAGYNVIGPNGHSIFLPAEGFRNCDGGEEKAGIDGMYWTSSEDEKCCLWYVKFRKEFSDSFSSKDKCNSMSVRLIKKP